MQKKEKKSKKQKKKEREEKRRLEEELLRQQQEEEVKRQEELERQRAAEKERQRLLREKRRKEELIRLEKETQEDVDVVEKRQFDLNRLIAEQSQQTQWKQHLKCDPLPDISNERQLNDFLTEWTEYDIYHHVDELNASEHTQAFHVDHIKYFIQDIEHGYQLLHILQDVIYDAIQQNDLQKARTAQNKYMQMCDIAQHKIEQLTQKCLKDDTFTAVAEAGMREDGDVMQSCMQTHIKFGLWASSMSNAFKDSKIEYEPPISIRLELPKQIAMKAKMALSCRVTQIVHHSYAYCNHSAQYECVGPLIDVQLFKLPPLPRNLYSVKHSGTEKSGEWMVQHMSQVGDTPSVWEYANVEEPDKMSGESLSVSCKIPSYVVIGDADNIKLGWWNRRSNEWKVDHFKDICYDAKQRILSFTTCHLSPICLVQPKAVHHEYADWRLTPSGVERCKISLLTKSKLNVEIEIVGGQCRLLQPEIDELAEIRGKLLKPHQLIRLLKSCGIDLCYKTHKTMSSNLLQKHTEIESFANLEISNVAALFAICMSKWNRLAPDNENIIVFRIRKPLTPNEEADLVQNRMSRTTSVAGKDKENEDGAGGDNTNEAGNQSKSKQDEDDVEEEDDVNNGDIDMWQTVMVNAEKCTFIDCNEKSKQINLETPSRELSHKTLLRCLAGYCTEDNIRDLENTSFRFKETIRRMLNLLNLFRV